MTVPFIPLNDDPFRRFLGETKEFEIRNVDSPVARQVLKLEDSDSPQACILSRGYAKTWRLKASIGVVYIEDRLADLDEDVLRLADIPAGAERRFIDPDAEVMAIGIGCRQGAPFWLQAQSWEKPLPSGVRA